MAVMFWLVNGQVILAPSSEALIENDDHYYAPAAYIVTLIPDREQAALSPIKSVRIMKHSILYLADAPDELCQQLSAMQAGIVMPETPNIDEKFIDINKFRKKE